MTLQALGAIGEWIGGIAVLISIIYLAIQVRSLRQEMHLNSYRDQTESYNAIMNTVSASTDLARVLEKAEKDVTSLERWEWFMLEGHLSAWLNTTELALVQIQSGSLEDELEADNVTELFFSRPGADTYWNIYRGRYPKSLQERVERVRGRGN